MEGRRGLGYGAAAYFIWGLFPLYWPLLEPAGAVEVLAHRIVWSALTMALVVLLLRRTGQVRSSLADRRVLAYLVLAAAVISINWGTYIWGVSNGRVTEAALGYFITPLVTVLMGVLFIGERLRPAQWAALGLAAVAVLVLAVDYGGIPWVAAALALSFGTYGLAKKKANTGAVESLAIETVVAAPFAAAYLGFLAWQGSAVFGTVSSGHTLLFLTTGIVTAIPLVLFGASATRVSMVAIGILQYLAPILQFALGVLWFHEEMPAARWAGFGLVWLALVIFTFEAIGHRRRQLRLAAEATAV
ncbi:EamA family transporter RarD [Nocardioides limicola]|uniref:EamA family transporter RarD n=1 Tax=Nocardioides limicola TaxID=2803368 RepID=UPI0027DE55BA|nr:EamA family transporter RarD [Nocardioides sp. DJM-14]